MHFLRETVKDSNIYIWYIGGIVSIALLLFVILQVDLDKIKYIFNTISWGIFLIAILVLLSEGFFTALRFKLFTPGNPPLIKCLELTAWFIISLIILPARLGEIAVIILLKNNLGQSTGSSIMNVLTQRFIDLLFLCSMSLAFVFLNQNFQHSLYLYLIIFTIMSLLFLSLYKLDVLLGFIASLFFRQKIRPKHRLPRTFFRMSLQARIWYRFHMNNDIFTKAILVSLCKWISNVGGLALLLYSLNLPLGEVQLLLASTAYNFLAIIPLQTIGGLGISEAGLAGILVFFGLSMTFAASVSIMIRLVLISTPFIFFLFINSLIIFHKNEQES